MKCSLVKQSLFDVFTIFFLMVGCQTSVAQQKDSLSVKQEHLWIEKMTSKIAVDISLNNSYDIFKVKTPDTKFVLQPNTPNNLKIKANYDFLSLALQFSPTFLPGNGDEQRKGTTNSFTIETTVIGRKWFADVSYEDVTGYYLKNTNDFTSWSKGDPYLQFPHLRNKGITMSLGYSNNPLFSYRSLRSQTERQLQSVGTFMPTMTLKYFVVDDTTGEAQTQRSTNLQSALGPGYMYSWVFSTDFYVSLGASGSIGYAHTNLTTRTEAGNLRTKQDNFLFQWLGKTGIGYNSTTFYSGFFAEVAGTSYNQQHTTAVNSETRVFYHFFLGMRFKAPTKLERIFSKLKNVN